MSPDAPDSQFDSRAIVDRLVRRAFDPALVPLDFRPTGRHLTWARDVGELRHIFGVNRRTTSFWTQWGLSSRPAAKILWGDLDERELGFNVVAGDLVDLIGPTRAAGWTIDATTTDEEIEEVCMALKVDLPRAAAVLEPYRTRRALWRELVEDDNRSDRLKFLMPNKEPFRLAAAAALAVSLGDPQAPDMVERAVRALKPFRYKLYREQIVRLESALQGTS